MVSVFNGCTYSLSNMSFQFDLRKKTTLIMKRKKKYCRSVLADGYTCGQEGTTKISHDCYCRGKTEILTITHSSVKFSSLPFSSVCIRRLISFSYLTISQWCYSIIPSKPSGRCHPDVLKPSCWWTVILKVIVYGIWTRKCESRSLDLAGKQRQYVEHKISDSTYCLFT